MAPAVAQRNAAQLDPRRPDGAELAQNRLQDGGRGQSVRSQSAAARVSNSPPGRASSTRAKTSGLAAMVEPRRRSRSTRPSRPARGLASLTWKCRPRPSLVRRLQRRCVGAQGSARIGRECTVGEHGEAGERQSLRSADCRPAASVAIFPARSGAGIEQDADDGEVEGRSCPLARIAPCRRAGRSRPTDRDRRQRNVASARGRARRARDRLCAWSPRPGPPSHRGGRDRRGNEAARPRARSPAADARARAPPWRSKGKMLPLSRASRAHVRSRRDQYLSSERPTAAVTSCGLTASGL